MSRNVRRIPDSLLADTDSTPTECALIYPYPGSMPAYLASRLVDRFSSPGDLVFDPFCGIGTVVLEALRLGRRALGADLLPLAVQVTNVAATLPPVSSLTKSWREVQGRMTGDILRSGQACRDISAASPEGIAALRRWVHPDTFEEITDLQCSINNVPDADARQVFHLVLASCLPTLSKRRSRGVLHWGWIADNVIPLPTDLVPTDPLREVDSRLAKLFAFMHAVNKGGSLAPGEVAFEHDWTAQSQSFSFLPEHVDLLLTSPPYPYSIDYALSTRLSGYLLGVSFDDVRKREIGARYKRKRARRGQEYSAEISSSLTILGSTVRRHGRLVVVLPDPNEYASIVRLDDCGWTSLVLHSLGDGWQLEEQGVRSYSARRVVPFNRPQRHDHILVFRRV